jgi:hypothetical protein
MGQLKKAGHLENVVANTLECFSKNPALRESFELFKKSKDFLKPYTKEFMPEIQCRELIHKTGIPTFPRPKGIPENFKIKISNKGSGMKYIHPENEGTYIRVMPGKPHSPNFYQQKPYINRRIDGKSLDKFGNIVENASPEAHISIEDFIYKGE